MIDCGIFHSICSFFTGDDCEKLVEASDCDDVTSPVKNENDKTIPSHRSRRRMKINSRRKRVSPNNNAEIKRKNFLLSKDWFSRRRNAQKEEENESNKDIVKSCSHSDSCDNLETIKSLKELYPRSTYMERYRFATGRTLKRSTAKMDFYMKWREQFYVDDESFVSQKSVLVDDEECWNFVVSHTAKRMNPPVDLEAPLPRIVRFGEHNNEPRTINGKRIAHILAAMIDLNIAPQEFYSACVATYLDFKLDRDSLETIAVLVDVRAGTGWPNHPAMNLLPFIKSIAKTLSKNMPERLDECIVYPLPSAGKVIWVIVSGFLDPKHVDKIRIIWGASANPESPAPVEKMTKYFDTKTIDYIEKTRKAEFRPIENDN